MAKISLTEADFVVLAGAANDAFDNGDIEQSEALDKMARKLNASLSKQIMPIPFRSGQPHLSWSDMPSTIVSKVIRRG